MIHIALLLGLQSRVSDAFVLPRGFSAIPISRSQTEKGILLGGTERSIIRDTTDNEELHELFGLMPQPIKTAATTNISDDDPITRTDSDVGKELFLSSLQDNAILVAEAPFGNVDTHSSLDLGGEAILQATGTNPSVYAVLAASEEAAVAAEAALLEASIANEASLFVEAALTDHVREDISSSLPINVSVGAEKTPAAVEPARSDDERHNEITAPTVMDIVKFAIPAIGVWLCGPLLSMIDTSCVGILSGTSQQAALNPAVAVTEYTALLIAFLYTGTTNLVAAARETDRGVKGMPKTARTFVGAMQLSTYVGTGLGLVLFTFAQPILRALIGNDGISPAVFDAAMKYVRIRALGMPAAAILGTAQAACLGMHDVRSPLYVLGVAAVINFMGDLLFVGNIHPWLGGAAGAAWATVFSQYAALAIFANWLCQRGKPKPVNVSQAILELTGKPYSAGESRRQRFRDTMMAFIRPARDDLRNPETSSNEAVIKPKEHFSVRGFLEGTFRNRDFLKPPQKEILDLFKEYVVPVTSTQVGRVSGYVAMAHVVASSLGTLSMAAHQILISLFYCLCPVADSLSLTAQSFLPSISEKPASRRRAEALGQTQINFKKAAAMFGVVMMAAVSSIPLLSGFFTTDAQVIALVNQVTPLLIGFFAVHGGVTCMEGLLLGRKDLSFLGRMYAGFFVAVPWLMMRVKQAALAGSPGVNLKTVWSVFLGYQWFRFLLWNVRLAFLQRHTERKANSLPVP